MPNTPRTASELEQQCYSDQKNKEHAALITQPYRTLPVVQPQPKVRHDYPTGSYLKMMGDGTLTSPLTPPISPKPSNRKQLETPESLAEQEERDLMVQKQHEHVAVVNQPYRTAPVVHPEPKVKHDMPMGLYLRHYGDGAQAYKPSPSSSPIPPYSMNQNTGGGSTGASPAPPQVPPMPAGAHNVRVIPIEREMSNDAKLNEALKQVGLEKEGAMFQNTYNSPIGLYSKQNVKEALVPHAVNSNINNNVSQPQKGQSHEFWPDNQQGAMPQRARSPMPAMGAIPIPVHLVPSGQVESRTVDFTQSPTYQHLTQLVKEMDVNRDGGSFAPSGAKEVKYSVKSESQTMSSMTSSSSIQQRTFPAQSQSFNALMNSLISHPDV